MVPPPRVPSPSLISGRVLANNNTAQESNNDSSCSGGSWFCRQGQGRQARGRRKGRYVIAAASTTVPPLLLSHGVPVVAVLGGCQLIVFFWHSLGGHFGLPEQGEGIAEEQQWARVGKVFQGLVFPPACLASQQNKPYSVLNIHDNLHGIIKKPVCQRVLDTLADKYVGW